MVLKRLRDEKLRNFTVGRWFIAIYDAYGPTAAFFIVRRPLMKKALFVGLIAPLAVLAARILDPHETQGALFAREPRKGRALDES